jgi:hypothetical protein
VPLTVSPLLRRSLRASAALASQPRETADRVHERMAARLERRSPAEPPPAVTENAPERLHDALGAPWPCPTLGEFDRVWDAAMQRLRDRGLDVGRGAFCGWDNGDPGLARTAWCLTRHLRPSTVVETGVARGLTTRVVLEALQRHGAGGLWSVDLPPLTEHARRGEVGAAVPPELRARWTLLVGSSRRVLPVLTRMLGHVDLFLHDSLHTTRNVRFELDAVWPTLTRSGAVLADDVEKNRAFAAFAAAHPEATALVFAADDGAALFGCLLKPGARR